MCSVLLKSTQEAARARKKYREEQLLPDGQQLFAYE